VPVSLAVGMGFESLQGQQFYLFSETCEMAVEPTGPLIDWVPARVMKVPGRGVRMTTGPHVMPW
jgi:hypothetical protein